MNAIFDAEYAPLTHYAIKVLFLLSNFNKEKKAGISGPRRWHEARERGTQRTFLVRELKCFRRKHTSEASPPDECHIRCRIRYKAIHRHHMPAFFLLL